MKLYVLALLGWIVSADETEGDCIGEIKSMNERCNGLGEEDCLNEGKSPFSNGVCDWIPKMTGNCVGEIKSMNERCKGLGEEDCLNEGKSPFSNGVCDWIDYSGLGSGFMMGSGYGGKRMKWPGCPKPRQCLVGTDMPDGPNHPSADALKCCTGSQVCKPSEVNAELLGSQCVDAAPKEKTLRIPTCEDAPKAICRKAANCRWDLNDEECVEEDGGRQKDEERAKEKAEKDQKRKDKDKEEFVIPENYECSEYDVPSHCRKLPNCIWYQGRREVGQCMEDTRKDDIPCTKRKTRKTCGDTTCFFSKKEKKCLPKISECKDFTERECNQPTKSKCGWVLEECVQTPLLEGCVDKDGYQVCKDVVELCDNAIMRPTFVKTCRRTCGACMMGYKEIEGKRYVGVTLKTFNMYTLTACIDKCIQKDKMCKSVFYNLKLKQCRLMTGSQGCGDNLTDHNDADWSHWEPEEPTC